MIRNTAVRGVSGRCTPNGAASLSILLGGWGYRPTTGCSEPAEGGASSAAAKRLPGADVVLVATGTGSGSRWCGCIGSPGSVLGRRTLTIPRDCGVLDRRGGIGCLPVHDLPKGAAQDFAGSGFRQPGNDVDSGEGGDGADLCADQVTEFGWQGVDALGVDGCRDHECGESDRGRGGLIQAGPSRRAGTGLPSLALVVGVLRPDCGGTVDVDARPAATPLLFEQSVDEAFGLRHRGWCRSSGECAQGVRQLRRCNPRVGARPRQTTGHPDQSSSTARASTSTSRPGGSCM